MDDDMDCDSAEAGIYKDAVAISPAKNIIRAMSAEDRPILDNFCCDNWTWNRRDKSDEVKLSGTNLKTAQFHPNWSNGTAGVRGTKILNGGRHYWEVHIGERVFGTSMMIGIGTKKAKLHTVGFINLLGEDANGWGLSHKGLIWHDGIWRQYTRPFEENVPTTIGILFDGVNGTLSYYKDGRNLGVAFTELQHVPDELYPIICSTAAKTEMHLCETKREFGNLQDRCRSAILKCLKTVRDVNKLHLPNLMKVYLKESVAELPIRNRPVKKMRQRRHNYIMRSSSCGPHRLGNLKNYPYVQEKLKYYI